MFPNLPELRDGVTTDLLWGDGQDRRIADIGSAISWSVASVWISGAALVLIFTLTLVGVLKMIEFAKANPQAALFEGAELLIHERMKMGMKDLPELPKVDEVPTLPSSETCESSDVLEFSEPDKLPSPVPQTLPNSEPKTTQDG